MDNTPENIYQTEGEKAIQQEKLYEEIYQSLRNDKKILDYYKNYNPDSVDRFLKDYAKEKINILEWGPSQVEIQERQDLEFSDAAFECLKQIQQKKLFDLQCQWRAELITLEGVETTDDFGVMAEDILNCKLIPPVSEAELDMFINFLNNEEFLGLLSMPDSIWQLYIAFKKDYEGEPFLFIGMPEWYSYHNLCTGNTKYLILPDIRGDKEHHYMGLADNKRNPVATAAVKSKKVSKKKDIAKAEPVKEIPVMKPRINYYTPGYLSWFVHEFEDKKTAREFKNAGGEMNEEDEDEDKFDYGKVDEIVNDLSADGKIRAVEANYNWALGLQEILHKYQILERKEAISPAYEQYCMYIENGISFESKVKEFTLTMQQSRRAQILEGRKIAGEPEDFNF